MWASESYSKPSGQVLPTGLHLQSQHTACCVVVHCALHCCMFSLCMTFYMLLVSIVATLGLLYFGVTPKMSRRNMNLILWTEESFIDGFLGCYHSGVKLLINQDDNLKYKCWSKKKKYCETCHLHFISVKILPYLNKKCWLQHRSEYQQRWELWALEQLQIIERNCSVLTNMEMQGWDFDCKGSSQTALRLGHCRCSLSNPIDKFMHSHSM